MKIKELKKILNQAPDENKDVYIPHTEIMTISKTICQSSSTSIGNNFDDNNDLELYVISED